MDDLMAHHKTIVFPSTKYLLFSCWKKCYNFFCLQTRTRKLLPYWFFCIQSQKKKNQKFIKDYCQTGPDVVSCWGSPCALLLALCVSFSYKIRKLVFFFVGITYVKAKYMSFMGHCDIKLNLWICSRILAGIKVLAIYSIGNRNIW